MSGHNKWKQIKERKGKTDSQKSRMFSKFARLITVEAKKAGNNKDAPGVKAVVERARAANMPNENIERAIKKAMDNSSGSMETIAYEAYGPGGCALIIEALTDNKNKAAQEVKLALSKHGISLASIGSAMWAFKKDLATNSLVPTTTVPLEETDLEQLAKVVEELENCEEVQEVFTNAE